MRLPETQIHIENALRTYGVRALLEAVSAACDTMCMAAADNADTAIGKQWAAWSVAIEALADNRKLTDPGRA